MPTTNQEAQKITEIALEYLKPEAAKQLFVRLHEEVGKFSENSSVKESLMMMGQLMKHLPENETGITKVNEITIVEKEPAFWVRPAFIILVTAHHALLLTNLVAFFMLAKIVTSLWFVSIPLMTYISWKSFSRELTCPLTDLENKFRKKLGMDQIKAFVRHYYVKPIKNMMRKRKKRARKTSVEAVQIEGQDSCSQLPAV